MPSAHGNTEKPGAGRGAVTGRPSRAAVATNVAVAASPGGAAAPQRALPAVDALLRRADLAEIWRELGPAGSRLVIRAALADRRRRLAAGEAAVAEDLGAELRRRARLRLAPSLCPVINATGTVLHTNLGRAPLAAAAAERLAALARGYSNLEFDLAAGRRGRRDVHVEALACEWTGAERTLVVNNNAAAVLLALNTLAAAPSPDAAEPPGEAVVSRGELVEIGGSFRVPDILARSGARLVEVGTTNRTRIDDYRAALTPRTRLLLRVHRSNFTMRGFVAQPSLAELVALGRERGIPVVEDLGSGAWLDLAAATGFAEPLVAASIAASANIVTYSGDKLLGGPQAGLISGQRAYLDRLRANPLFRALRADRLTYAALETTLRLYAQGREAEIPVVRMLRAGDQRERAAAWRARLAPCWRARVVRGESVVGGGAAPGHALPTHLVALAPRAIGATILEARLRQCDPPVIARIAAGRVVLDPRTVAPEEEAALFAVLDRLATALA